MRAKIPVALSFLVVALAANAGDAQVVPCGVFGSIANSTFSTSLSFWTADPAATWSPEDAGASPSSGSVQIAVSEPESAAITQCVQVTGGERHLASVDIHIDAQGQVEGVAGIVVRWFSDTACADEIDEFPDSIYLTNAAQWATQQIEPTSPDGAQSALIELRATKIAGPGGSTFTANLDNAFFAFLGTPDCADPICSFRGPSSSDAQFILSASVRRSACLACYCDVDGSGVVSAVDALAALRAAVELPVTLACPACE